jgi:type I restriction enzyme S subunit
MMSEKTDIPKLRFLGLSSDWETSKAASIFQINAGGDVPKDNVSQEKTGDFQYPIFANASENKGFYGYSDK